MFRKSSWSSERDGQRKSTGNDGAETLNQIDLVWFYCSSCLFSTFGLVPGLGPDLIVYAPSSPQLTMAELDKDVETTTMPAVTISASSFTSEKCCGKVTVDINKGILVFM